MLTVQEKLRSTEFDALSATVRDAMIAEPFIRLPVKRSAEGFILSADTLPFATPPKALFPKLGIKSWRSTGRLQICQVGRPIKPHLDNILGQPTRTQMLASRAWEDCDTPMTLYLFPFMDFSEITEVRFLSSKDGTSFSSACLRGASAQMFDAAKAGMRSLIDRLTPEFRMDSVIFDVALMPGGRIAVVDINPGLTPADITALRVV